MSYEQKMFAIMAICGIGEVKVLMREPGNWYLSATVERVEGCVLSGGCVKAIGPESAIEQYWSWLTEPGFWFRLRDGRRVQWNGFMWLEKPREIEAA